MKRKVTIITANELDTNLVNQVESKFKITNDDEVSYRIDENILGGIIVQIDDEITDASVKTQLNNLKSKLLNID